MQTVHHIPIHTVGRKVGGSAWATFCEGCSAGIAAAFRRMRSVQLGTERVSTSSTSPALQRSPMSAGRSQEGRGVDDRHVLRHLLGATSRNATGRRAGVLRTVCHLRQSFRATGEGGRLRNRNAGRTGTRWSDHEVRIVSLELCGEEHVSPTGAKIVQTGLDRLARDETGGEGGSDAPFLSASTVIEHHLAFFQKSMFNLPASNGLMATVKSS